MPTTVRQAIRAIGTRGRVLARTEGSHRRYRHPTRPGTVTIPGKPSNDLAPGTWGSIRKQAGLED